jgi:hypothetical protein
VFLDEPIKQDVIEMIDYIDNGNRINFDYTLIWAKQTNIKDNVGTYNLMTLLVKVYNLFVKMPPLSLDELFGAAP